MVIGYDMTLLWPFRTKHRGAEPQPLFQHCYMANNFDGLEHDVFVWFSE